MAMQKRSDFHDHHKKVREPVVEGIFYPLEKRELEKTIKTNLENCGTPAGKGRAILVPHAGYTYCAGLLASAFNSVSLNSPSVVVSIGPTHTRGDQGIFLTESDSFRTPLGEIRIASELSDAMTECGTSIIRSDYHHMEEHCLEVAVPFIQTLFPGALFLPVLVQGNSPGLVKILAGALNLLFSEKGEETLFIITSNLFGFTPKPESITGAELFISLIKKGDPWEIVKAYEQKKTLACGALPAAGLIAYLGANLLVEELGIVKGDFMDTKMKDVPLYGSFCFR